MITLALESAIGSMDSRDGLATALIEAVSTKVLENYSWKTHWSDRGSP